MTYTQPLLLLCICLSASAWLFIRSRRRFALGAFVALTLVSWPPAAWLFSRPLEARYPLQPPPRVVSADAIVVLGAAADPPKVERPYPVPNYDGYRRCGHAAWLHRRWGGLPVLASAGRDPATSETMMELLTRGGVPRDLIWMENESRSTHENAVLGAAILRRHGIRRIALVVDATSMPRAAACFRKEGFDVFPAPSEFRTFAWREDLLPSWHAVRENEIALHEALGWIWYRIRGWI